MNTPPTTSDAGSNQQTSGLAIGSLVLGISSIVCCLGPLAGIPAVIMGHKANSNIRKSGGLLRGSGMATAGLVTGYLSIFMIAMWGLLAAVAIPNFVKARNAAQYNACLQNQAAIQEAKELWAKENEKPDDAVPLDADLFGPGKNLLLKPECPAGGNISLNAVKEAPYCAIHSRKG
jgi:Ca2+/Na+ antiporter